MVNQLQTTAEHPSLTPPARELLLQALKNPAVICRWEKDVRHQLSIQRDGTLEIAAWSFPHAGSSFLASVSLRLPALLRGGVPYVERSRLRFRRRILEYKTTESSRS